MVIKESEIRYMEDALLIENKILVLGDFHIGYDKLIEKEFFPKIQFKEIIKKLERIFRLLVKENIIVKQIIVLGDLKHEFGEISNIEWNEGLKLLDYLDTKIDVGYGGDRIVLIKGNHDNFLENIASKRSIKVKDSYKIKNICFMHGDKLFESCLDRVDILVIGHLHPAITLKDNYKGEKYKCFLRGMWKRKLVYIVPSFNPVNFGFDLSLDFSKNNFKFIINKRYLKKFKIIIYNPKEDKEYCFGNVEKLIR